ncbi:MAG TPA: hypothetical protein VGI97_12445 [Gemmatimonadaceae bacterium]
MARAATRLARESNSWERSLAKRLRRIADANVNHDAEGRIQKLLHQSDIVHVQAHIKFIEWTLAGWSTSTEPWAKKIARDLRRRLPTFRAYERMLVELLAVGADNGRE